MVVGTRPGGRRVDLEAHARVRRGVLAGLAALSVWGPSGPADAATWSQTAAKLVHARDASPGRQFYVSPDGDDGNSGTSPDHAWRTLARVNAADLLPGDHVHLRGTATFAEPLAPYAGISGTSRSPIVFDSYGRGTATLRGGIYLNSVSDLAFTRLAVRATRGKGVFSSAAGSGAKRIILRDVTISDTPLAAVSSNNRRDADWLIDGVRISRTGDSGIYFVGYGLTVRRSTILDTGLDAGIPYPRHGIYAKGADVTVTRNLIARFSTSGVSLRRESGRVSENRIAGGRKGVSFDDEATAAGTTSIVRNSISAVSDSGIAVASARSERFLLAGNTVVGAGRFGVYLGRVHGVAITDNVVGVTRTATAVLGVRPPARRYFEHDNRWHGAPVNGFVWNGSPGTFARYRRASGQGRSDLVADRARRP